METGKPGWGEGHKTVRGPAEAIWEEGHPKVGARDVFRKNAGRKVETMTLVN